MGLVAHHLPCTLYLHLLLLLLLLARDYHTAHRATALRRAAVVEKPYTTAAWPSKAGTQYGKTQTTASGMALTWWVDYK